MSQAKRYPLVRTSEPGIFKRGNRYLVVFRDSTGKQRRKSAATLAEARDLKASVRLNRDAALRGAGGDVGFTEYALEWLETYRGRTRNGTPRDVTLSDYRRALGFDANGEPTGKGAVAFFGNRRLGSIGPRDVSAYATSIERRGVSANTVRLALAPLRALFATAVQEELLPRNPAAEVRTPVVGTRRVGDEDAKHVLTPGELARVFAAIPEHHRLLVRFLAATGVRIGEACGLQWRDYSGEAIQVRRRWYRGTLEEPKTASGRRTIPLPKALSAELKAHKLASAHSRDTDFVFSSERGGPLHASNYRRRILVPAFEAAGIKLAPGLCFHVFRRSCGTWLGAADGGAMDLPNVAAWLGHADATVTLRHYMKPSELAAPATLDALIASEWG